MQDNESKPLDLKKFKELVLHESSKLNLKEFSVEGESSFTLSLALSAAVKKIFFEKSELTFSSEPKLEKKPFSQFVQRMRIDAMEKFNSTTVFSVVHFGGNEEELHRKSYMVTLIVYMEKKFIPEFMRLLQYPYIDFDEEDEVKDGCGTLANLIAGQYKREMAKLGYKDFMMSPFESYINSAPDGVGIPKGITEKYEISFELEGEKRLVVELVTQAVLPQWQPLDNSPIKKILVVDDDIMLNKILEPFLKANGYNVMIAHDGEEGIKKLKWCPDLIILDVQMPNMDGYEFILMKKKVEGAKQIPVIVFTAKEGLADIFKVEGAREYLLKPLQPATLLKSIQRHI